uniref:Tubulin nucleotide-binding domain-like superfamily protein n=1 Tax=Burkholderia phage vB_BgluM-SURPRISE13 TaxID=3159457 RepID=A0AAU7PF38_9VIRU
MSELNNTNTLGKIRIFCTGGAGIGIGKYFELERGKQNPGYAEVDPVYMDTSKASTFGVPAEYFYQLPEANGSGGKRSHNGADIVKYTGEMLQRFPLADFNIVIHSATGGSGSVMGPSIVSEALNQGKSVIAFVIGGDDTKNYIENCIGTLESYEGIVEAREQPVVLQFLQNGVDGSIEDIDLKVHVAISCLTALYSGQNKNLDERDLHHWLHFDEVTTYQPQVGVLSIHQEKLTVGDVNLISVATLNTDLNNTKVGQPVEYQRVGVPMNIVEREAALSKDDRTMRFPLHFAVADGFLDTVVKGLRKQVADYEQREAARVVKNKLSDGTKKRASNGLVF